MNTLAFRTIAICCAAMVALQCGKNLEPSSAGGTIGPPKNVMALSVNDSTVLLRWTAAEGAADTTFLGYVVQWGSTVHQIPKDSLSFLADSLPPGQTLFALRSLKTDGTPSNAVTIAWAPAARFDSAFAVFESNFVVSNRPEGFNVGTRTTNPSTMIIDPADVTVQQRMDLFFYGGRGQNAEPLSMWAANLFLGSWNQTRFSTVTHSSPSLDFPLTSFPDLATFTKDSIAVVDNTIYYARVAGDPQEINYARIHLRVRVGATFPNRVVEVRVSLQRVPGLPIAGKSRFTHRFFANVVSNSQLNQ